MNKKLILAAGGSCLAVICAFGQGDRVSEAFIPDYESGQGEYVEKSTARRRSSFIAGIEREDAGQEIIYRYTQKGEGDYGPFTGITWEVQARIREEAGILRPIYTDRVIKDSDGRVAARYQKRFDYSAGKVYWTAEEDGGRILRKEEFPLRPYTVDEALVIYFLKPFAANRGKKEYAEFYLVTNEPKLYRIVVKDMGEEILSARGQKVKAAKVKLVPDLGLLGLLAKAFVPPTYVWYTQDSPYTWLQYEGLEMGLGSKHIISRIIGPGAQDSRQKSDDKK